MFHCLPLSSHVLDQSTWKSTILVCFWRTHDLVFIGLKCFPTANLSHRFLLLYCIGFINLPQHRLPNMCCVVKWVHSFTTISYQKTKSIVDSTMKGSCRPDWVLWHKPLAHLFKLSDVCLECACSCLRRDSWVKDPSWPPESFLLIPAACRALLGRMVYRDIQVSVVSRWVSFRAQWKVGPSHLGSLGKGHTFQVFFPCNLKRSSWPAYTSTGASTLFS